jgi:hypothetical protein
MCFYFNLSSDLLASLPILKMKLDSWNVSRLQRLDVKTGQSTAPQNSHWTPSKPTPEDRRPGAQQLMHGLLPSSTSSGPQVSMLGMFKKPSMLNFVDSLRDF